MPIDITIKSLYSHKNVNRNIYVSKKNEKRKNTKEGREKVYNENILLNRYNQIESFILNNKNNYINDYNILKNDKNGIKTGKVFKKVFFKYLLLLSIIYIIYYIT